MLGRGSVHVALGVLLFTVFVCDRSVFASESSIVLAEPKAENIAKIIRPPDVPATDVRQIRRLAVSINSPSLLFAQLVTDLLSVKLRDAQFDVIEQTKVSEAAVKELSRLEAQVKKEGEDKKDELLSMLKLGKQLRLDAVLVGVAYEARRQMAFSDDKPPQSIERVVVSTFYVQLVEMKSEKTAIALILEYDKGMNIKNAVDQLNDILLKEMRK